MSTSFEDYANIFKAFCDENRLQILSLLSTGEQCACILLPQLNMSQSGLSYHMKILVESGVVDSRQEGKWTHYKISKQGAARALALLEELTTTQDLPQKSHCCPK